MEYHGGVENVGIGNISVNIFKFNDSKEFRLVDIRYEVNHLIGELESRG